MYAVKGFTVAEARARFGDLLDQAEQGQPVVIERRGVRFTLSSETEHPRRSAAPFFEWLDPDVEAGQWTWTMSKAGAAFRRRGRKQR
jgi:hypothetical protein